MTPLSAAMPAPHARHPVPLSVLDVAIVSAGSDHATALRRSVTLARHAERLGYTRFWTAEHHAVPMIASSAPDLIAMRVADATRTIRIGAGGVMLPNHAPLQVAERFLTLEAFHPGRIDLGVGRAPGSDRIAAHALGRRDSADYPEQVAQLAAFLDDDLPPAHPYAPLHAVPHPGSRPPIFLLGSSLASARLAAARGSRYAFGAHFSTIDLALNALAVYRDAFQPSSELSEPYAIVVVSVTAADTDEAAARIASASSLGYVRLVAGDPGPLPTPQEASTHAWTPDELATATAYHADHVIGGPEKVGAELTEILAGTGADELMLTANIHSLEDRLRSYEIAAASLASAAATATVGAATDGGFA